MGLLSVGGGPDESWSKRRLIFWLLRLLLLLGTSPIMPVSVEVGLALFAGVGLAVS